VNQDVESSLWGEVAEHWLARTLATYPLRAGCRGGEPRDRFLDPAGYRFREAFPVLVDELLGELNIERVRAALEQVIRIRAVQDFTPSEAVGFVFFLKDVLRHDLPGVLTHRIEQRIDEMALIAFDLLERCRWKMDEIRAGEARRSTYLPDRIRAGRAGREAP